VSAANRERGERRLAARLRERHDQREADTHVEGAIPLFVRYVATPDEFGLKRRHAPPGLLEDRLTIRRQRTRHVIDEAAARNMRHRFNVGNGADRAHGGEIRRMLGEQRVRIGYAMARGRKRPLPFVRRHEAARERIAVGVQTDRGQADDRIARPHARGVGDRVALRDADDRAGEIEMVRCVEARHLGRFSPEQRTVVGAARALHARHDIARDRGVEFADGQII
jgi:hypothetical protein